MSASNTTDTGLRFPSTGPTVPDASEIRQAVIADFRAVWGQDLDVSPYTPQGQLIDTITAIIHDKNSQLLFLSNQWNPEINEGKWQEDVGKIYFITRKPETPTIVACQCTGIPGTTVLAESALAMDTSRRIYKAEKNFVFTSPNPVQVNFICQTPGPVSCPANTLNRIYQRQNGWDTINNPSDGVPGSYEESRMAFEHRRYLSVAKNAHGNVSAVWGALADLDDVVSVRIAENIGDDPAMLNGVLVHGHSMFISIWGGDANKIAWTIYERKDAGCGLDGNTPVTIFIPTRNDATTMEKAITFNRPSMLRCAVKVNISANDDTVGNIDELIKSAVKDNWNGLTAIPRVQIGDVVMASRFYCTITNIDDPNFALNKVKVARVPANFPDSEIVWEDSIGFTLDEFPAISDEDIHIVRGEDPENGDESSMLRYNAAVGGATPKSTFLPPDRSPLIGYNAEEESVDLNGQTETP